MGIFQHTARDAFLFIAFRIGKHTFAKPRNAVNQNTRRQLSSGKNIISHRYFFIDYLINRSSVNSFIVTAYYNQTIIFRKHFSFLLIKNSSLRRHINGSRFHIGSTSPNRRMTVAYRFRRNKHSSASAVRSIIDPTVLVPAVVSQLMSKQLNRTAFHCPSYYTFSENIFNHIRKQGYNIKSHQEVPQSGEYKLRSPNQPGL